MLKIPFETTSRVEAAQVLKDNGEYTDLADYIVGLAGRNPNVPIATVAWNGKVLVTFDGVKFTIAKEEKCLEENQEGEEAS